MREALPKLETKNAESAEACNATLLQKNKNLKVSREWIIDKLQKVLKFGPGVFLVVLTAYCVARLTLSTSYDRDPILEIWDEFSMTAREKLNIAWHMMKSNQEPEPYPSILETLVRFLLYQTDDTSRVKLQQTFRPFPNKKKVIHTQSAFGKIRWNAVPTYLGYTGLLADSNVDGIISFSFAPNQLVGNFSSSFGVGVKLLRDNALPGSFVSMFPLIVYRTIAPIGSQWNIFAQGPICTHLSFLGGLGLMIAGRKQPASAIPPEFAFNYPNNIGLLNLADATATGQPVTNPRMPYTLCLRPNAYLAERYKNQEPWKHPVEQLRKLPPGTHMFDLVAVDHPRAILDFLHMNSYAVKIGEIWSNSEFISSKWGDQMWFIQHQDWELDLQVRPEWRSCMNLRTIYLEGLAYLPISPLRGPTLKQFVQNWFPFYAAVHELIFNSEFFLKFICIEVGLCRISEMITDAVLAQGSPDRLQIYGYSAKENPNYSLFSANNNLLEGTTSAISELSKDEIKLRQYFNVNESDKLQKCDLNAENAYDCYTTGVRASSNVLYQSWKHFLTDWLSLDDSDEFSEDSTGLSAISSRNFADDIRVTNKLEHRLETNFAIQGHYLLPTTYQEVKLLLQTPSIVTVVVAAVLHMLKPYARNTSLTNVAESIHEVLDFLTDPEKVAKFFSLFPGIEVNTAIF